MAVWSQISTSNLVGAVRLDAEFWQPYYLVKEKMVRSFEHVHLGTLVSKFKKGIFYILAREYAESGIPFYRSSNIGNILPKEENIAFISEKKHNAEHKTALVNGDLMIVKTGKSGAAVVLKDRCNVSQDVIAVKVMRERINPFYLVVYLNTTFGFSEMDRWFQGQVQPHLSLEDARKIWVPIIPFKEQGKIEQIILNAARAKDDGERFWSEAQHLLESELGLDKLSFQKPVGYTARFIDTLTSGRFDADFFQVPFRQMHKHLDSIETEPLSGLVDFIKGIEVGSKAYSSSGYPFLRVSNIKEKGIELGASDKYISESTYRFLAKLYQPKIGELLLTKDGTPGICYAVDDNINGIISGGIMRLIPKVNGIPVEYLALVINSEACRMQIEQECSGALILHWKPSSIRKLRIPLIRESRMRDIADMVTSSKNAQRESMRLLHQAKSHVEQLIEEAVRR